MCICACVWVQTHMEAKGHACFLISTIFWWGGDRVFHCARTHQAMARLVGMGNPEIHLPGWHFLVLQLLLHKLFLVWVLRIELRSLACKVLRSFLTPAPEDTLESCVQRNEIQILKKESETKSTGLNSELLHILRKFFILGYKCGAWKKIPVSYIVPEIRYWRWFESKYKK